MRFALFGRLAGAPSTWLLAAGAALLLLAGCRDSCTRTMTYTAYEPVYMTYADLRAANATGMEPARVLKQPGKIYFKERYLLINERNEGIHVFDNADPAQPRNLGFLRIPGNVDMAMQGDLLYADSYLDLLVFDLSNPAQAALLTRVQAAIPQPTVVNGVAIDPSQGVVQSWTAVERTEEVPCDTYAEWGCPNCDVLVSFAPPAGGGAMPLQNAATGGGGEVASGVGGSMQRFTIVGEVLYVVDNATLRPFSLAQPAAPVAQAPVALGVGIETIFPYNGHLFIGSETGMHIYSVANPLSPAFVSTYTHLRACDPVVVEGNLAYVTLRDGTACGAAPNVLEVINVSNLASPYVVASYQLTNPHGLGIRNGALFVCDGADGLRVFDATQTPTLTQVAHHNGIHAYDVIPLHKTLFMIGHDGLFQYDSSTPGNLALLSSIPVQP